MNTINWMMNTVTYLQLLVCMCFSISTLFYCVRNVHFVCVYMVLYAI